MHIPQIAKDYEEFFQEYLGKEGSIKVSIAQRIIYLLQVQEKSDKQNFERETGHDTAIEIINRSNCHQTALYALGMIDYIGRLEKGGLDLEYSLAPKWNQGMQFANEKEIKSNGYFEDIDSAISNGDFPILCIFFNGDKVLHSIVLLGKNNWGYFGFEQKFRGGRFGFDYLKKIKVSGKKFFKPIT